MSVMARLDEMGKPAWIGLLVLSFVVFWPLGLALLAYLMWSGRMGCWRHAGASRWQERMQSAPGRWYRMQQSSGNRAFDEYREETLRRLEEEQREFKEFLDRLRHAKDKVEFDQFMAERTRRTEAPESQA
jgi:Protein of unknown function (DUF2852)